MQPRPRSKLLVVAIALLSAGCLGIADGSEPDKSNEPEAEEIIAQVEASVDEIEDTQYRQTVEVEHDGEVETTVSDVWLRPPLESRVETIESSVSGYEGYVMVSNGDETWVYNNATDEVRLLDSSQEPVEEGDELLGITFEDADATVTGTATVDDRETYVLELDYEEGGTNPDEQTVWIDREHWYPLKHESTVTVEGDQQTTTTKVTDITFNDRIADDRFEFDPPADADVIRDPAGELEPYDTLEAANETVPFTVTDPDVPDSYDRIDVAVRESRYETGVAIAYEPAEDGAFVWFTTSDNPPAHSPVSETVQIGDSEGALDEQFGQTSLHWACGELHHTLTATGGVDSDELVDVAESVSCEGDPV